MIQRRKICLTLPEETIQEMEKIKQQTGLPVARQIDLALKGYKICRIDKKDKNEQRVGCP
ncbi:MAG: hypothetical protein IMZ59_01175 [Actinobacteria bacterium]|nr:hypothetical protein [Actinomycetota bacterium]